jgi:predicted dehydrogenase
MWAGPPDLGGVFDVEDSATGLIRFPGGLTVELNVTWAVNLPEGLLHDGIVLLGDQGGVTFDVWGDTLTLATEEDGRLADVKTTLSVGDAWGQAWQRQSRRFADCVDSRSPAPASGEDGRAVQAVLDAMYESAAAQREVGVS